ncbi:hypothetical protein [Streptomyces cyaneofuscatus]|uniref:hypothetical protein n=1 Tax=Streptomyces cyaneofuscatus TaxID=66883 RepID=UPI0036E850A7
MSPSLSNDDAPAIPGALEPTPGPSRRRSTAPRAVKSNLVAHARTELRILGEDRDTIRGLPHAIAYLERLLRFQPLTDLTDDPAEWIDRHAEGMTPIPLWQSNRNSEAFSTDGGKTYYLLSEQQAAGDIATTPLHHSKSVPQLAEAEEA